MAVPNTPRMMTQVIIASPVHVAPATPPCQSCTHDGPDHRRQGMGRVPSTEFPCTIHRFTLSARESSGRPGALQPLVHQIDRLVDGAIPRPVENTIRFRPIAATCGSQHESELVSDRATALR
jgi:hypothetical protein